MTLIDPHILHGSSSGGEADLGTDTFTVDTWPKLGTQFPPTFFTQFFDIVTFMAQGTNSNH